MSKPVAIVAGYLVRYPLGGHVLSQLHFLVGLQRLGYEVVFAEQYGWPSSCYDPRTNSSTNDPTYGIAELRRAFEKIGVNRWCYVDADGNYHGMSREELGRVCCDADFLLSVAAVTWLDQFRDCKKRIFWDADPGFTQFGMPATPAPSCDGYASPYDFQFHFTIGERIGKVDCPIPTHGLNWRPTRWPMALELVTPRFTPEAKFFTTIMSWSARKPVIYNGEEYGQKDVEFIRIFDLPKRVGPMFEIALAGPNAPREQIAAAGWRIANPLKVTATPWTYLEYIAQSRGEFSVAVNLEVKARSGWFSDRTAVYLASGKPAIVQDTGFSEIIPCGEGLFAFSAEDDVVEAVEKINSDYAKHCRAARAVVVDYFDSDKALAALLRACDLPVPADSGRHRQKL